MAAGLGFKDFVTGEVLTAADVDGYLMQGIWVFASAAARDAAVTSPQEGNACYLKDTNQVLTYSGSAWVAVGGGSPLTTKGDVYGFSTVDARIPIGANNTVLTADSTQALGLKWAAPAGGGKVLQVISTVKSNSFSATTAAAAFTDVTDLSVAITPTSNTSKILVLASVNGQSQVGGNLSAIRIVRDSTAIFIGDAAGSRTRASTQLAQVSQDAMLGTALTFLDSPATTSSTTYKIQGCSTQTADGYFYINRSATDTDNAGYIRAASSITVMEIGA